MGSRLGRCLGPFNCFFTPRLSADGQTALNKVVGASTSNRKSLICNGASSRMLNMHTILLKNSVLSARPLPIRLTRALNGSGAAVKQVCGAICRHYHRRHRLVVSGFPGLGHFLANCSLHCIFGSRVARFSLAHVLANSRKALTFVARTQLSVAPLPGIHHLIGIGCSSFSSTLHGTPFVIRTQTLSMRAISSGILGLTQRSVI